MVEVTADNISYLTNVNGLKFSTKVEDYQIGETAYNSRQCVGET